MKPIKRNLFNALAVSLIVILLSCAGKGKSYCLTGAFLGGRPTREDIVGFRNKYGKKPLLVMVFVDWTRFMVMESTKHEGPVQNAQLIPSKAEELAQHGCDANKILKVSFPHMKMGVTIDPDEVALR